MQSTKLSAAVAALIAQNDDLKAEVADILADDLAKRQKIADAVSAALAAEGASQDAIAATLDTVSKAMASASASVKALLAPAASVTGTPIPDAAALMAALANVTPGQVLSLAPGQYDGLSINGVAGPVKITAADPTRPPVLTPFYAENSKGLTFDNVELFTNGSADPYPFRMVGNKGTAFSKCHVHGALGVSPVGQMSGLYFLNCTDVLVDLCEIEFLNNGVVHSGCDGVSITRNKIHDTANDGADSGGSSNYVLADNWFRNIGANPDTHNDAAQCWTVAGGAPVVGVSFKRNVYERGEVGIAQGFTVGDEASLGYSGIDIDGNLVVGGLYNGIAVGAGSGSVTNNKILQWDDQPSWLVLRYMASCSVGGNQAGKLDYIGFTPTDLGGNAVVGAPEDKGASDVAAWRADHPYVYGTAK